MADFEWQRPMGRLRNRWHCVLAALAFNKSNADTAELVSVSTTDGARESIPVIRENVADVVMNARRSPPIRRRHRLSRVGCIVPRLACCGCVFFSRLSTEKLSKRMPSTKWRYGVQTSCCHAGGDPRECFNSWYGHRIPTSATTALPAFGDGGRPCEVYTPATSLSPMSVPQTSAWSVQATVSPTSLWIHGPAPIRSTRSGIPGCSQPNPADRAREFHRWRPHLSEPVAVSTDQGTRAFVPSVAVNDHGDVAVTYYSFSASSPVTGTHDPYWITLSPNGGRPGRHDSRSLLTHSTCGRLPTMASSLGVPRSGGCRSILCGGRDFRKRPQPRQPDGYFLLHSDSGDH
jgi:hypothetical protein